VTKTIPTLLAVALAQASYRLYLTKRSITPFHAEPGQLPASIVSGAPPTPGAFRWSHMPSPDAISWNNGGDPHGIAVFTSVVDGKPYGFLVRSDQAWVARIDLEGVTSAPLVAGGLPGQVDIAPFVFFLSTR